LKQFRIPLVLGNGIEVLGIIAGIYLLMAGSDINTVPLRFLIYLLSWVCLVFFPHCLAHFAVGRLVGVRFTHYLLGKSSITKLRLPVITAVSSVIPLLTLKIDRGSLRSVGPGARAVMFASGAIVSMVLPFLPVVVSVGRLPAIWSVCLLLLSIANICFDLYYSPRAGDLSRI
jgi:hypothetical protein